MCTEGKKGAKYLKLRICYLNGHHLLLLLVIKALIWKEKIWTKVAKKKNYLHELSTNFVWIRVLFWWNIFFLLECWWNRNLNTVSKSFQRHSRSHSLALGLRILFASPYSTSNKQSWHISWMGKLNLTAGVQSFRKRKLAPLSHYYQPALYIFQIIAISASIYSSLFLRVC